jgi:MoxR-like ATPase
VTPEETARRAADILDELEKAVVGRRRTLELVLIGILAGGHVLLEDLPGLGKTLIRSSTRAPTSCPRRSSTGS